MTRHKNHDRIFSFKAVEKKRLTISLTITAIVLLIEILGGIVSNSIALLSDAGHMFTHAFAISISLLAIYLARKPSCHHRTFGLYRAEVLAAFVNGLFLLVMVGFIVYEAVMRLLKPVEIEIFYMILIAIIGLSVNIASILILQGSHKEDLNIKGVFFHMLGDALSSIAIVIVSVLIYFTDWTFLDPLVSFLIAGLIISWSVGILKESGRILLEMTPPHLNIEKIEDDLKKEFTELNDIYHTHLWTITPDILVLTTHLQIDDETNNDEIIQKVSEYLFHNYKIIESTIQVVHNKEIKSCNM
ncbi:MAG: Cadmium, cobalt and zinc/H(+)-K(+) antiporter [Promethearchaeota archaeon]|nr:MAG: Cadmium, cobalt and zinc/H(+)-K(+) antiporter [Candidatus Lokiarchaeota archaeon]